MSAKKRFEQAYSATDYLVLLEDENLRFHIGQYDAEAERRLKEATGCTREWFIITPCNPRSQLAREELNLFYFNELRYELETRSGDWFKALNHDPNNAWPDEPGFLIVDADRSWIMDLGRRFYQNALVTAKLGHAPRLLWLVD